MKVELTRFRVNSGKARRVDQWMETLNRRREEAVYTMEREQIQIEVIFREEVNGEQFLYWFSIQGEAGASVESSPHDLDRVHMAFWNMCIDKNYAGRDARPQLVLVRRGIADALGWKDAGNWINPR